MTPMLATAAQAVTPYRVPRHPAPIDLDLSATELPPLDPERLARLASEAAGCRGYPDQARLRAAMADRFGVDRDRVLLTAGSDEALDRTCRATLAPGTEAILTAPTFEMLPRFVRLAGAAFREVPWPGAAFPTDAILAAITPATRLVAIVTPNNPTGCVAPLEAIRTIARRNPEVTVLVDLAYVEFADDDPTSALLAESNVVVTRTLSKAWGMASWRVGIALGDPEMIAALGRCGTPYPVSGTSLAVAAGLVEAAEPLAGARIATVREVRARLAALLEAHGLEPLPSQADFVTTAAGRAPWLRDALAGLGIGVRWLPSDSGDRVRITCPLDAGDLNRLAHAIETAMCPGALLFDLDGVLADVSGSYRATIVATARRFGAEISTRDVARRKAAGHANDDWVVTHDLITQHGIMTTLPEVTDVFETIYQGTDGVPGMRAAERLIPSVAWLRAVADRLPLAIVTGRPRADAERFLGEHGIADCFDVVVCREDAPLKPDPEPVRLALRRLAASRAWMIGDTPDDLRAARAAGVVPIGIPAPGEASTATGTLHAAGAARVLTTIEDLATWLP